MGLSAFYMIAKSPHAIIDQNSPNHNDLVGVTKVKKNDADYIKLSAGLTVQKNKFPMQIYAS